MLRLDSLSNIIAWSRNDPANGDISIDLIELPRLHLTFEKMQSIDGTYRYFCAEQSGLFIAGFDSTLNFENLLEGLPHAVIMSNIENEYFVMLPSMAQPTVVTPKGDMSDSHLVLVRTDEDWIEKCGEGYLHSHTITSLEPWA